MPVIKASGYGTYINRRLDIINQFDIVAVANVDEGVELRELGYEKEIFVLNQPYESEIDKIINYNITVGISSYGFAEKLSETNKNVTVHVEIGTGMGRTGVHPYRIEKYLKSLAPNIKVEGMYTHFSSADIDDEYSKKQLKSFNIAVAKAKVIFLKDVPEGTSIGYSRSYITTKDTKVANVPIGYADGFRRDFSNGWEVLIKGKKVPIIGNVCMDSFMVDVTEIDDVQVGDEVIIWDNKNITLEQLAEKCDTINYEILCTIGERVPRKFIKD